MSGYFLQQNSSKERKTNNLGLDHFPDDEPPVTALREPVERGDMEEERLELLREPTDDAREPTE